MKTATSPALATKEAAHPEGETSATLFPARLLGMGLVFTWDWSLTSDMLTSTETLGVGLTYFNFVLVVVEVIALVVLAALHRRIGTLFSNRKVAIAAAACGIGAPAIVLALQVLGVGGLACSVLLVACAACVGFSVAVLMLLWAEVYSAMEPGRVLVYGALSLVFGVLVHLVLAQSSDALAAAASVLIPAVSFPLAVLSHRYTSTGSPAHQPSGRYSFPWKPVLIMGVCGFAAAFVDVSLFMQGTVPHVAADLICGVAIVVWTVVLRKSVKPVALVGTALACMAAGIVSVAVLGSSGGFAASLLTMLSYVVMTFFTYALLAHKCFKHDVPVLWLFGFAMAARVAMDHLGGFASMWFPQVRTLTENHLDLAVMSAVGLVVIGVVAVLWMSERSFDSSWTIERLDAGLGVMPRSEHEVLLMGVDSLAASSGLTDREAEILDMLVEGRTYQQMCSSLILSPNTVKTHARHVYGKLGVHTREEAVELARATGEKLSRG